MKSMQVSGNDITFKCNVCDCVNSIYISELNRESPTCIKCGSTVRMRSMVHALTTELFGRSLAISEIHPPRPDIVGIGMSCWHGYAGPLAHKIAYKNTYYHQSPMLDITNIDSEIQGSLDFIVSSDVFEHVIAPINVAFDNVFKLLKPGGVFIICVPNFHPGEVNVVTTENFVNLYEYNIVDSEWGPLLRNITKLGEIQYFHNLVFHGGEGQTLEMRRFSEWSLIKELEDAGFHAIKPYGDSELKFGVHWTKGHFPFSARKPLKS